MHGFGRRLPTGLLIEPSGRRLSYARRQQYRRLWRASEALVGSAAAAWLAFVVASIGVVSLAGTLVVVAFILALYARHWFMLAARSSVGALGR